MRARSPALLSIAASLMSPTSLSAQGHSAAPAQAHHLRDADEMAFPRPTAEYARDRLAAPFELFRGTRIFLQGAINSSPMGMMLDTGASSTVLDTAFARKLGITGNHQVAIRGATGSSPGEIATGITIKVGALTLHNATVMIMDLTPIAQAIGRPIPVILGHDAIDAGPVRIDFPGRTMTFMPANGFTRPAGATELPLGHDGPFRSVKVSVAGLPPIDATFDIGNGGSVLLAKSYWEKQPRITGLHTAKSQIGGVGGLKPALRVTLPEVSFAGQRLQNVPASLNEDRNALPTKGANVGIEMLKPFVVTADYANDRIYLEKSAEWSGFRKERAGIMAHYLGDRLKVQYVSPDGPAASAGLKTGDEIVAVDGRAVGPDFYGSSESEWALLPAGQKVTLTRADGSQVVVTLRDYY